MNAGLFPKAGLEFFFARSRHFDISKLRESDLCVFNNASVICAERAVLSRIAPGSRAYSSVIMRRTDSKIFRRQDSFSNSPFVLRVNLLHPIIITLAFLSLSFPLI